MPKEEFSDGKWRLSSGIRRGRGRCLDRAKELFESDKVDLMFGGTLGHDGLAVHEWTFHEKP